MRPVKVTAILTTLLFVVAGHAQAASITTTFAGGNQSDGNMFDLTTSTNPLLITGLDVVTSGTGSQDLLVYYKVGTYSGFENDAAAWTLVSSTSFTGQGYGNPAFVDITDFLLAPNTLFGIYITIDPTDTPPFLQYTTGSNTYSNTDLQLSLGAGLAGLFGSEFGGFGVFSPRIWNGTIYYDVQQVPEPGSLLLLLGGLGAAGTRQWRSRRRR